MRRVLTFEQVEHHEYGKPSNLLPTPRLYRDGRVADINDRSVRFSAIFLSLPISFNSVSSVRFSVQVSSLLSFETCTTDD